MIITVQSWWRFEVWSNRAWAKELNMASDSLSEDNLVVLLLLEHSFSILWKHFGSLSRHGRMIEPEAKRMFCKLCKQDYSYVGNAMDLWQHLEECHTSTSLWKVVLEWYCFRFVLCQQWPANDLFSVWSKTALPLKLNQTENCEWGSLLFYFKRHASISDGEWCWISKYVGSLWSSVHSYGPQNTGHRLHSQAIWPRKKLSLLWTEWYWNK